ncbi:MAG: hypothetical protein JWN04_374 [Myxococcaceae bacterium]|nr:hypothetical protein [Myxococcaceae bacterium]
MRAPFPSRGRASTLALAIALSLCSTVRAQDAAHLRMPRLSDRGRQMVDGSLGGSWSNEREPGFDDRSPRYSVWLQPSWVYFIRDRIGLGAYLGYRLSRVSTGYDSQLYRQAREGTTSARLYSPLNHDLSAGITAAVEVFVLGRLSLYARPYLGLSVLWRAFSYSNLDPGHPEAHVRSPFGFHVEHDHELRAQLGVRLPLVYQLSNAVGLGFGPDLLWENLAGDFNALRLGVSSWLALSI